MQNARRYNPTNSRFFDYLIKHTYGIWLYKAYNTEIRGLEEARNLEPPFVLIGNHVNILDPFFLSCMLRHPVYWVTSDGNMRTPLMRFLLLKVVGSIPKSKAIPDIETVNWIVEVIRKRKGIVGIFPEGQASWDGRTIPAYPSTAKLLKILKAPVLCVNMSGAYLSLPRWTRFRRKGKVILDAKIIFRPEDFKTLCTDEIFTRLTAAMAHDECGWQKSARIPFKSSRRAENLELALFLCPRCGLSGTMKGKKTTFGCGSCGFQVEVDEYGEFSGDIGFRTIPDWEDWQKKVFTNRVSEARLIGRDKPILTDDDTRLLSGWRMERMKPLGRGKLVLYADALEFHPEGGATVSFPVGDIEGAGIIKHNFLEFYVEKTVYRVRFPDLTHSGRPWALALDILGVRV